MLYCFVRFVEPKISRKPDKKAAVDADVGMDVEDPWTWYCYYYYYQNISMFILKTKYSVQV